MPIDRGRLSALLARETEAFAAARPRSRALFERAGGSLLGGVPMPWMMRWAGGFPVFAREASGARIVDVDGHEYVDLCLGDTGAMPGHGPPRGRRGGARAARPRDHDDAADGGRDRRSARSSRAASGCARWLFTLTATDANRTALRLARQLTGRPLVLVFSYCYHGSVDEAFAVAGDDGAHPRARGQRRPAGRPGADDARDRVQRPRRRSRRRSPTGWWPACWPSRR